MIKCAYIGLFYGDRRREMRKERRRIVLRILLCIALALLFIHLLSDIVSGSGKGETITILEREDYCTIRDAPYVFTAPYQDGWRLAWEFPLGKCSDGRNHFLGIDLLYRQDLSTMFRPNING